MDHLFTLATAIGDGCIGVPSDRPNSRYLSFTHSSAQRDYLVYKVDRINQELGTKAAVSPIRDVYDHRTGKTYQSCQSMIVSPSLKPMHRLLYPGGRKKVTRKLLDHLGLEGLAIYWMDDGSVVRSSFARNRGLLASYCTEQEALVQCEWIKRLTGVNPVPYRDREHYRIRINASEMPRFLTAIRPHMHSSMAYKATLQYSSYNTKSKREYEASLTIPFVDEGDKATRARNAQA